MSSIDSNITDLSPGAEQSNETVSIETTAEPEVESLPVDVIFEVLKNERRRRVIQFLRDNEGPAKLGTVAEHIAALENGKDVAAISYAERKRVYVGLYQCHLPKMDDMGVVDFNRARGRLELTEEANQLIPYIEGPVDRTPWYRYYGGVVLAGFALLAATGSGLLPSVFTPQIALVGVLTAVGICSVAHYTGEE